MKKLVLLATCAVASLAAPASAAPVIYTLEGLFSGTSSLGSFSEQASFVGVGDTTDFISTTVSGVGANVFNLSSLTVTVAGISYDLGGGLEFAAAPSVGAIAFGDFETLLGGAFTGTGSYDGTTSLAATPVSLALFTPLSFGGLSGTVTGFKNGTFSAQVAAIPEPTTWALSIVGFGAIGATLRRRPLRARMTLRTA